MADNEPTSPGLQGNVWDYVRRRNELDREIQEKFARPVTIMFTDIKGSTTFFDMRGDLEGVTMLQRHNDLVVPPIESEGAGCCSAWATACSPCSPPRRPA